jgi:membrane protein DedA with SNARE-associated domain
MGNRPATYWVLVLIAIGMAVAGFAVRSSPEKHAMAQYLGWGAIALLVIARFFFRKKPDTTPPMPKD